MLPWPGSNFFRKAAAPMEQLRFPNADSASSSPGDGAVRLRMLLAYDGSGYRGVTPQPGQRTVGGAVAEALTRILRQHGPVRVVVAGRTDAGVHAWGQVLHADVRMPVGDVDLVRIRRSLSGLLGDTIVVRDIGMAPAGFHARFSAQWRSYRYLVLNELSADPVRRSSWWHVGDRLDVDAMALATDPFLGDHDFTSFGRTPKNPDGTPGSMRRVVLYARWLSGDDPDHPGLLRFEIRATSFCQQMVRSIVGFLVEVGRGRRHAGDVLAALAARKRQATMLAPPHGLSLWAVGYPDGYGSLDSAGAGSPAGAGSGSPDRAGSPNGYGVITSS